ncbi:hypothetical protein [Methylobacterium sp. SyP6R]|uniref:hypothetical protein n=1 Tax=Methylobacterium sp. SyP6R TaxID=2718876 RepID=UPI001F21ED13|nr:hypothetical protein [Methylobacterium sp. SyP6R]MCF4126449.1 hypothetical protein [Methylobacterium sp. SyP6R]
MADVSGLWTYRSYRNDPALISGDPDKAAQNIFGEGVFDLRLDGEAVTGMLDMGGGYVLDLTGSAAAGAEIALVGLGRAGTPTAGWEYDYRGVPAYRWPNGVGQVPALVGTVIRAKPHGGAPAGTVASFIAVKRA